MPYTYTGRLNRQHTGLCCRLLQLFTGLAAQQAGCGTLLAMVFRMFIAFLRAIIGNGFAERQQRRNERGVALNGPGEQRADFSTVEAEPHAGYKLAVPCMR